MPEGRTIQARITAMANPAYNRLRGHIAATENKTSTSPKPSSVGLVPKLGMNQNTGRNVPRMLPAVDSAYTRPAVLPPDSTFFSSSRIANGLRAGSPAPRTAA